MTAILENIKLDIISKIPQGFIMSARVSGGGTVDSVWQNVLPGDSVNLSLDLSPVFSCGLDGSDCQKDVNVGPIFSGSGYVRVDNVSINLLPACQP
jgi:hypothetical protein